MKKFFVSMLHLRGEVLMIMAIVFVLVVGVSVYVFQMYRGSERIIVGDAVFSVEVVRSQSEQRRGLGYRDVLCAKCGMLFLFDRADYHGIWMKGMRFPIDILWIRDDRVVFVEKNVSEQDQLSVFVPSEVADRVLELNAGSCEKFGITVGDVVRYEL